MSVINELSCKQGRKDEVPNKELAKKLVNNKDKNGIKEIIVNLWNKDRNIQSDGSRRS